MMLVTAMERLEAVEADVCAMFADEVDQPADAGTAVAVVTSDDEVTDREQSLEWAGHSWLAST